MLRRLPTSRLLVLVAVVVTALAASAAIAVAALNGSGPTPPPKPLDVAIRDAARAPSPEGVTARITFTNRLIDKSSIGGSSPLLSGATGRLWAAQDGRLRLELQSDNGDAQIVSDGKTVTIYDATQNVSYRVALPPQKASAEGDEQPPTLARIDEVLKDVAGKVALSGADPSNTAGRESYTVRISSKHDGGLVGAGQIAWDAATGTPLRAAIYASGDPKPVLALEATDISFGRIADADLNATVPQGTKVTDIDLSDRAKERDHHDGREHEAPATNDPQAIAGQLPFELSAPDELIGLPRRSVRVLRQGDEKGALVTYGAGLGGLLVLERPADPKAAAAPRQDGEGAPQLPKISIDGADGQELATALGTVVQFTRGGVQYTVLGSVPPNAAETAARAL